MAETDNSNFGAAPVGTPISAAGNVDPLHLAWVSWFNRLQVFLSRLAPTLWGTHAERLALAGTQLVNGELFIEYDRTNVIYQYQRGTWVYLAGTMWGTLSPDQRPTDLGVRDAGFHFRGTDQQREFIWSGSAWVEITPIGGATSLTHPNVVTKVGPAAGSIQEGGITDLSAPNSGMLNITAAGNVGIGTASPAVQASAGRQYLTISGSTANGALELVTQQADADGNQVGIMQFSDKNSTSADKRIGAIAGVLSGAVANNRGGELRFFIKNDGGGALVWAMVINKVGNVGINTAAPNYMLDVLGDINASGVYRKGGAAGVTTTVTLAKVTTSGANGSLTIQGGIVTGFTAPT